LGLIEGCFLIWW